MTEEELCKQRTVQDSGCRRAGDLDVSPRARGSLWRMSRQEGSDLTFGKDPLAAVIGLELRELERHMDLACCCDGHRRGGRKK